MILASSQQLNEAKVDWAKGCHQLTGEGMLDCSTLLAMVAAGRLLLLKTIGVRAGADRWRVRDFKIEETSQHVLWKVQKMLQLCMRRRT